MKKWSSKLESTRKTEQDRPYRKFWLLVKGQRKKVKVKVNWSRVKVNGYWSGSVLGFRVRSQVEQQIRWRHPMTCRWRGLGLTWMCLRDCWRGVMTSSTDVRWHQQQSSARVRRMLSPPAHEEDARNPGGAWRRVRHRMTTRFSGQVNWWTTRPSRRGVYQEDDLEVRNLRRRVVIFQG